MNFGKRMLGIVLLLGLGLSGPLTEPAAGQDRHPARFGSLRASEANLRTGPGTSYPIEWVYKRKDLPIQILAEFGNWRKIRDWQGTQGWMHHAMLSLKRTAMVVEDGSAMHADADAESPVVAHLEQHVLANILACPGDSDWCLMEVKGYQGWSLKNRIWGFDPKEIIE